MALIKCFECGTQVSDKAANCPNCGAPVNASNTNAQTPPASQPDYFQQQQQLAQQQQVALQQQIKDQQKAATRQSIFMMIFGFALSGITSLIGTIFRRRIR